MTLLERIQSKTPAVWRTVTKICLSIKTSIAVFLGYNFSIAAMPTYLVNTSYVLLGVCVIVTGFAESQVKKPEEPKI